jgi:hypothetical protein
MKFHNPKFRVLHKPPVITEFGDDVIVLKSPPPINELVLDESVILFLLPPATIPKSAKTVFKYPPLTVEYPLDVLLLLPPAITE